MEGWWNAGRQRLEQSEQASPRKPRFWWLLGGLVTAVAAAFAVLGAVRLLERVRGAVAMPTFRSLAVRPLENLSVDPSRDDFAEGMMAALLPALARLGA